MTSTILEGSKPSIKFYTRVWTPTETPIIASVCFVHGFIEHIDRYNHVFEKMSSEGIAVFAYDQRGFGQTSAITKSQGVTSWSLALKDIDYFVSYTAKLFPNVPTFLVGHSMGGGLSLAFATRNPSLKSLGLIKGVVCTGPLLLQHPAVKTPSFVVLVGSLLGKVAPSLTMKTVVNPSDVCRDPVVSAAYAADPLCSPIGSFRGVTDMLIGGENLMTKDYKNWPKNLPLLIAHGSADKVTSHDASQLFVQNLKKEGKDATFKSFDGFYHELVQEPGEDKWQAVAAITDWIKAEVSKQASAPAQAKI